MLRTLKVLAATAIVSAVAGCSAAPTPAESSSAAEGESPATESTTSPTDSMVVVAVVKLKADAPGSTTHLDNFKTAAFGFRSGKPTDHLYQRVTGLIDQRVTALMGTPVNEFLYYGTSTREAVGSDEAKFAEGIANDADDVKFTVFREFQGAKTLNANADSGGFPVLTFANVKPGTEDKVVDVVGNLAVGSRLEAGNHSYRVAEGEGKDANAFLFYERWPVGTNLGRLGSALGGTFLQQTLVPNSAFMKHMIARSKFQEHLDRPLFGRSFAQLLGSLAAPPEIMELREITE